MAGALSGLYHAMMRRWPLTTILVLLAVGGGCRGSDRTLPEPLPEDASERFAQAVCAAEVACGCGLHASASACEAEVAAAFDEIADLGLTIDEDCFDEYLASPVFAECSEGSLGAPGCVALVGFGELGDACVAWNLFTMLPGHSCKEGLQCSVTGVCQEFDNPMPIPNDAGAACNPEFLGSCALNYCVDETKLCAERAAVGEPCVEPDACEFGAYCQGIQAGTGICTSSIELGQPCSTNEVRPCAEGWCDAATQICTDPKPFVCANQPVR